MRNAQHIPSAAETVAIAANDPNSAYGKHLASLRPAPEQVETTEDRIMRLETELATVKVNLADATDAVNSGDAAAAARYDLPALATQSAELRGQLIAARRVLEDAERNDRHQSREQQKRDFETATEQARQARTGARRAYVALAVALGIYCDSTRRAISLNHEIRKGGPFPDPERVNQLLDLENRAELSPLNELRDKGYTPLMDFGHNLLISVPPLLEPGKKEGK